MNTFPVISGAVLKERKVTTILSHDCSGMSGNSIATRGVEGNLRYKITKYTLRMIVKLNPYIAYQR